MEQCLYPPQRWQLCREIRRPPGPNVPGRHGKRPGILIRTGKHFRNCVTRIPKRPDSSAIRKGVQHLIAAAQHGHTPAQCRLATELHLGEGRLGIKPDIGKAVAWYRLAAKHGDPVALQSLVVLEATHPETVS